MGAISNGDRNSVEANEKPQRKQSTQSSESFHVSLQKGIFIFQFSHAKLESALRLVNNPALLGSKAVKCRNPHVNNSIDGLKHCKKRVSIGLKQLQIQLHTRMQKLFQISLFLEVRGSKIGYG